MEEQTGVILILLLITGNILVDASDEVILEVKNGGTLYVRKSQFNILGDPGEPCKVQVVENEPMYQRVGQLTPKIFDCDFSKHSVRYQHNGSPFLSEDQVKLRVSRLSDAETIQDIVILRVRILNADCEVIKTGSRELVVPAMNEVSNPIRKDVLFFNHDRLFRTKCEVRVASDMFGFPEVGQLVVPKKSNRREYEPLTLTSWDCDDFVLKEVRYQHLVPPTPNIDYIPLHAVIRDKRSRYILKQEYHWLPVRIAEAFPNQIPSGRFTNSHIMEVDQFVTTNLLSTTMSASDSETKSDKIIFNVTKPPEQGFIVHLNDESKPVNSFYQKDISDLKIAYQPPNSSFSERQTFYVEFVAIDTRFAKSEIIQILLSVRVSRTKAPRISWNMGLTMLEGQSRKINKDCLQVVYHGSLDRIRMTLAGGLQHGRLLLDGQATYSFSWNDIENREVMYQHDDSDTLRDFIMFQISDIVHSTRFNVPVEILPKDDSPPALVNNLLIEGSEGQIIHLYTFMLEAFDEDSSSDYVKFNITRPPNAGVIQKRKQGDSSGWEVHHFEQRDLNLGNIIYKHSGDEVFEDSFDFVLMDSADPYPNVSPAHTARIKLTPVDDQPPVPVADIAKSLVLNETDIAMITPDMLSYIDEEDPKSPLKYIITQDVTMLDPNPNLNSSDPGHLFLTDDMVMPMKSPGIPHLKMFSQDAIDHNKVAYMPPMGDIGLQPLTVFFIYSVSDSHGTTLDKERFLITILPIDNQAPELHIPEFSLKEGESEIFSEDDIIVTDYDTTITDTVFIVKSPPKYGQLKHFNDILVVGNTFTYNDLADFSIQYTHDGSENFFDSFELVASDGIQNSSTAVGSVTIVPVDDEIPTFGDSNPLLVNETSSANISSQHLSATDVDTDDDNLIFYIVAHPAHGQILLRGQPADSLTQLDIRNGEAQYQHNGDEIGYAPRKDVISFIVEDGEVNRETEHLDIGPLHHDEDSQDSVQTLDLNVVILPVDNRPPNILIGSAVFECDEGGKHVLTSEHIWATDLDTSPEKLIFHISSPSFGYLEDQTPREGYEKQISVPIDSFNLQKLSDGMIRYVQSKHRGIEPTVDTFTVKVTDGKHPSAEIPFLIAIAPTNDEPPFVKSDNFSCNEGGMFPLTDSVLQIVDGDIPANEVMVSVSTPPQHGMLFDEMQMRRSKRSNKRAVDHSHLMHEMDPMSEFSMHDWSGHVVRPAYLHDGTENSGDSFRLKISDGQHTYMTDMAVNVLMVNDEKPTTVTNKGITVELGDNAVLNEVVLYSADGDNSNDELIYILHSLPTQGSLQKKDGEEWVDLLLADTFTEQELADNKIRYLHTDVFSTRTRDSFRFSVTDGTWTTRRENFEITIQNKDRGSIHIVTGSVSVEEGRKVYITTDVLSAKDGFDRPQDISYEVITQPAFGQLEHIANPSERITAFSQMDLMARKIIYSHQSKEDSLLDSIVVEASNGIDSREAAVMVDIVPVDVIPPSVTLFPNIDSVGGVKILTLFRGAALTVNDLTISIVDPDTSKENVHLIITTLPLHGILTVNHRTVSLESPNVTLAELQNDELMYENNGEPSAIDRFSFVVSDSVNAGYTIDGILSERPSTVNFQIDNLDNTPPTVTLNVPTNSIEMIGTKDYGVYIDSHNLMASDRESANDDGIRFSVTHPPSHGLLKKKEQNGRLVPVSEFSVSDLKTRKLIYTVSSKLNVTNDSFVFDVEDDWANVRMGYRFSMSWARIEVGISSLVLCENKTSAIDIRRYGNLRTSSFVGAKVVYMNSASEGRDFSAGSAQQIQFDPGSTSREWVVSAVHDGIRERKEKFKMLLHTPVNAVLEVSRKGCNVVILDSGSRKCKRHNSPIKGYHNVRTSKPKKSSKKRRKNRKNRKSNKKRRKSRRLLRDESVPVLSTPRPKTRKYGKLGKPVKVKPVTYFGNRTHRRWEFHGLIPITIDEEKVQDEKPVEGLFKPTKALSTDDDVINDEPQAENSRFEPSLDIPSHTPRNPIRRPCNLQMYDRSYYDNVAKKLLICNGASWVEYSPAKLKAAPPTKPPVCDDEWHNYGDRCYYVHPASSQGESWNSAYRKCRENMNAHLATISTKKHMNWLRRKAKNQKLWIGLNRKMSSDWTWAGGERVTYSNWKRNYSKVDERGKPTLKCALITERKKWRAKICEEIVPDSGFVCMKETLS